MPDIVVARYLGGVDPPVALELSGYPPGRDSEFAIDWLDAAGNIALHFNPRARQGTIVLNSRLDRRWGEEVVVPEFPFPTDPESPCLLRFEVLPDRFAITAGGRLRVEFPHRAAPSTITRVRSSAWLWRLETGGRAVAPEVLPASEPDTWRVEWLAWEKDPPEPEPLSAIRLFAVLSTWMEEDVVAATVANAFEQGCERVYLVDNGSDDQTIERAVAAGATLARRFASDRYDELERIAQMQAVVDEISGASGADHVWWLWLDADEFHHGPDGLTLREYVVGLDRRFRIVGARYFNHLPDRKPAYVEGRRPFDCQPLCYELPAWYCELGHRKHPLQRWDRAGPRIVSGDGFHHAASDALLVEPGRPVYVHHFPFREEATTRRRFERLFGGGTVRADRIGDDPDHGHLRLRRRSLDAVYAQRWEAVTFFPPCVPGYAPELKPFAEWVSTTARSCQAGEAR